MTLREILNEIYIENKRFIWIYLTFAIMIATCICCNNHKGYDNSLKNTYTVNEVLAQDSTVFVTGEQGEVLGGKTYQQIDAISRSMGSSIDPIAILGFEAVIIGLAQLWPEYWGEYAEDMGLMNSGYAIGAIVVLVLICVVLKMLKANNQTKVGGLVVEDVENKIGIFLGPILSFVAWLASQEVTHAAQITVDLKENIFDPAVSTIWIVILMVVTSVVYYIVRTVIYAFEIISITFSAVPMSSFTVETTKTSVALFMMLAAKKYPLVVFILFLLILIVCLLLFKRAYMIIRYFKTIYIFPIFKKKKETLIEMKYKEKLLGEFKEEIKVFLPMFSQKKFNKVIKKYDKIWLLVTDKQIKVCKRKAFKKELLQHDLVDSNAVYFINNAKRYIEIFTVDHTKENKINSRFLPLKKKIHFVISREYCKQYALLMETLQMIDYKKHQKLLRNQRKEEKKARKINKKRGHVENSKNE